MSQIRRIQWECFVFWLLRLAISGRYWRACTHPVFAANLALNAIFANKGEVCVAGSRVIVQEGIYDELAKKLTKKAKSWVVGDPFDPKSQYGPQINKRQYKRVLSYVKHGKREGATLLTGGNRFGHQGYYIEPTVFTDVKDDMLIAKDEIFGPVHICLGK
ncbi:hypothetical protein Drorol1_Dr00012343 [Drosera rotundifolia]